MALDAILNTTLLGDCKVRLADIDPASVDLIVTSPPYADQRKSTYGGIHPDKYVEWFLECSAEFHRVLKPTGTFILNIKEKAINGERHTYVMELVLALRKKQGWLYTEEFMWHKKNCAPGKWPNRFRDAWEHCYHFNKQKDFKMYQEEVMVPIGDWAKTRIPNLSETDHKRDPSRVNSGFSKCVANWKDRDLVFPTNVLNFATECGNKNHSAAFPESLPSWFIRLFTKLGDVVLDPFMGSGTTAVAAKRLGRNFIGIDYLEENIKVIEERVAHVVPGSPIPDKSLASEDYAAIIRCLLEAAEEQDLSADDVLEAVLAAPELEEAEEFDIINPILPDDSKIICGECVAEMKSLPNGSVDFVITSPPYNIGMSYGTYKDDMPMPDYLRWTEEWMSEVKRILNGNGSFFLNIGGPPSKPWIQSDVAEVARSLGFYMQNRIMWVKSIHVGGHTYGHVKPIGSNRYLNGTHEFIYHFTLSNKVKLDRYADGVGMPFSHPSNLTRWKHGRKNGCGGNVWFLPYDTIQHKSERGNHSATFPLALPRKCLLVAGAKPNQLVIDPFGGIGTTAVAAQQMGLRSISIDCDPEYSQIAKRRVSACVIS